MVLFRSTHIAVVKKSSISICLFLCGLLLSRPVNAQLIGGTVSGIVTDASDAVVPEAPVVFRNVADAAVRALRTNDRGFYSASNLAAGEYEVTASAPGLEVQVAHLTLAVGAEQELNFKLHVGSLNQIVEVAATPVGIDLASSSLGAVVDEKTIGQLPVNGRSWTDLAVLAPGVQPIFAQPVYTSGNGRGNRGFGGQLAISGARPQQNNYLLDGISINDYSNGGPGSVLGGNLGVDAIQEFSVSTLNYSAVYGRASGGVITASTRPGTNEFHGSAYEFLRNSALDARNFFDKGTTPPFRRNQFGGSAGGPIVKNRTFAFGDYEGIRQSVGVTNIATVPSSAARAGMLARGTIVVDPAVSKYLAFYPLPNAGVLGDGDTGIFTFVGQQVTNEDFFTTRVDHQVSSKDSLSGTYRFDNAPFYAPDSLATVLIGSQTRNQMAVIDENHIFSPSLLNSLRFGVNRSVARNNESLSALVPAASDVSLGATPGRAAAVVAVAGLTTFSGGVGGGGTYLYHYTSFQLYDDLFKTLGRHSLKMGLALERLRDNVQAFALPNGQFTFGSLAGFLTNQPASFQLGSAESSTPRGLRQTLVAGYIQDNWRVHSNLNVNLGLRYEATTVPSEVHGKLSALRDLRDSTPHLGDPYFSNPTLHNFEPRVGFSLDPGGDGKTAIRSAFGMFDVLPLPYEFNLLSSLSAPFYVIGTTGNPPAGSFPAGVTQVLGTDSQAESYIEPHPHRNYVLEWNFNFQRSLTRNVTLTVGYAASRGVHQPFRTDDANLVLPVRTPAGYVWPSPAGTGTKLNPNYGQVRALFWEGNSLYDALVASVVRKFAQGFQIQGSLTWSKSIDTGSSTLVGNAFSNAVAGLPWYDLRLGRALADFNVPRAAVIHSIWDVPFAKSASGFKGMLASGWRVSAIFRVADGLPFTPRIAGDPLGQKSLATVDFPDRLSGPGCSAAVNPGNAAHYVRTECFAFPAPATRLGNAGRNELIGPGLTNLDLSLGKSMALRTISEGLRAEWRAEVFNMFNHPNFLPPLNNVNVFDATGLPIGNAGMLDTTATPSRQIQFALKLIW